MNAVKVFIKRIKDGWYNDKNLYSIVAYAQDFKNKWFSQDELIELGYRKEDIKNLTQLLVFRACGWGLFSKDFRLDVKYYFRNKYSTWLYKISKRSHIKLGTVIKYFCISYDLLQVLRATIWNPVAGIVGIIGVFIFLSQLL